MRVFWSKSSFFIINQKRLSNYSIIWKENSLYQDLLTKCIHKNINQQWTKEIWEDTSQWESNDTKYHQKLEIMKKSTHKRKSSTRIRVSSTRSSAATVLCDSANDPENEGDSYDPESGPPPLESNKDTLMILSQKIFKTVSLVWQRQTLHHCPKSEYFEPNVIFFHISRPMHMTAWRSSGNAIFD